MARPGKPRRLNVSGEPGCASRAAECDHSAERRTPKRGRDLTRYAVPSESLLRLFVTLQHSPSRFSSETNEKEKAQSNAMNTKELYNQNELLMKS
ncbi:MAG: hypothetical protein M1836_004586 [Candelina mexicana]|nr:MAG: hypothetical protein M1836_004586 [Candelina mexicana]